MADIIYFLNLKNKKPKIEKITFKTIVILSKGENLKKHSVWKRLKLIPCFVSIFKPLMKDSSLFTFMLKICGNKNNITDTINRKKLIKGKTLEQSVLILQNIKLISSYQIENKYT